MSNNGYVSNSVPLYGIDAETLVDGPQCSASGEFCFLCTYEKSQDEGSGKDLYGSIVDLIDHMIESKREMTAIIRAVFNLYNSTVRDHVQFQHPDTEEMVSKPQWSKASILRHLLYSGNHPKLFKNIVQHMLQSLIVRHNATMIDAVTGEPHEEKRKAFLETLKALQSWESHNGQNVVHRNKRQKKS